MSTFGKDGYTTYLIRKMEDYGLSTIWDLEDKMESSTVQEFVQYLRDSRCTATIGIYIRRLICGKYCEERENNYIYTFMNGETCELADYMSPQYNVAEDEVNAYVDVCLDIMNRWNPSMNIKRAEVKRLVKMDGTCSRDKLFDLSFLLHMNACETEKFLVDVLGEQTFNFRVPSEVIAFYCQSHEKENTYVRYQNLCKKYEVMSSNIVSVGASKDNYSRAAKEILSKMIDTESELFHFLMTNMVEFNGHSETAYREYMLMLNEIMEKTYVCGTDETFKKVENMEQLAKVLLACIPRATFYRIRKAGVIAEGDFVPMHNKENADEAEGEVFTLLPKSITGKLLKKELLERKRDRKQEVERKDLIYLRFFLLYLHSDKGKYTEDDRIEFVNECNDMLLRCGMSPLYVGNRFENLIMCCLYVNNPWEFYEEFFTSTFYNEPSAS